MQRAKAQMEREKYTGTTQQRDQKFIADLTTWAGPDHKIYLVGSQQLIEDMRDAGATVKIVTHVQLPPMPVEPANTQLGGFGPRRGGGGGMGGGPGPGGGGGFGGGGLGRRWIWRWWICWGLWQSLRRPPRRPASRRWPNARVRWAERSSDRRVDAPRTRHHPALIRSPPSPSRK